MKRIDFAVISQQEGPEYTAHAIREQMELVGDDLCLTDCFVNKDRGGSLILRALDNMGYNKMFTIFIRHDKWGNPVKPGQVYEWFVERKRRDMFGKLFTQHDIKRMLQTGNIRDIEVWNSAVVDEKCRIKVPYSDACILLNTRGVHFESKQPLTVYKEHASSPTPIRKLYPDEKMTDVECRLQHFWLYEEVPNWVLEEEEFAELEKLTEPLETKQDKKRK